MEASAFRHVVVPLGVVIGLGVGRMVTTLASYFDNRRNLRFCSAHVLWTAVTFIWLVGLWWVLWQFQHVDADRWSFFSMFLLLLGPASLYLAVSLLLPAVQPGEALDLGTRFDEVGRAFFLCLLAAIAWLGICEVVLLQADLLDPRRFGQAAVAVLVGAAAARPSRRFANVVGVLVLVLAVIAFSTFRAGLK